MPIAMAGSVAAGDISLQILDLDNGMGPNATVWRSDLAGRVASDPAIIAAMTLRLQHLSAPPLLRGFTGGVS